MMDVPDKFNPLLLHDIDNLVQNAKHP
jgi:hypothetical protein